MKNNIGYRLWQFLRSLDPPPPQEKLDRIRLYLSPVEMMLFTKMPIPDQNHSLRVFESVLAAKENDDDLIKAALLHDIGKGLHPLTRWERVVSVLAGGLFPRLVGEWGRGQPVGFKRPLVVLRQHPDWGADLARNAGCSEGLVWLIKHHEMDPPPPSASDQQLESLKKLRKIDNLN